MEDEQVETSRCFQRRRVTLAVHLPPFFVGSPAAGVRLKLSRLLLRYYEPLEGILLLYENVRLSPASRGSSKAAPAARILDDTPHLHFSVDFDAVVFAPRKNTWLVGTVTHVGAQALTLQMFGYFKANLRLAEMGSTDLLASSSGGAAAAAAGDDRDNDNAALDLEGEEPWAVREATQAPPLPASAYAGSQSETSTTAGLGLGDSGGLPSMLVGGSGGRGALNLSGSGGALSDTSALSSAALIGSTASAAAQLSAADSGLEWVSKANPDHIITVGTRLRFRSLGYVVDHSGLTVVGTRYTLQEELDFLEAKRRQREERRSRKDSIGGAGAASSPASGASGRRASVNSQKAAAVSAAAAAGGGGAHMRFDDVSEDEDAGQGHAALGEEDRDAPAADSNGKAHRRRKRHGADSSGATQDAPKRHKSSADSDVSSSGAKRKSSKDKKDKKDKKRSKKLKKVKRRSSGGAEDHAF